MIPLLKPSVSELELTRVAEVLKSGWWGLGPKTEEFERKFADYVGARYAVGVNSATSALDLALKVLDIHHGEVIVPALTFVSTALAPLYNNNRVVFADIEESNLCLDWRDVEAKTTSATLAVIPVHYAGSVVRYGSLSSATEDGGPLIIEDCAHACGNKLAGARGAISCWSFHAVKNLATGDGGMLTTNSEAVYRRLLSLRWCGIDRSTWERAQKSYGWDYSIDEVGYKYHMNDIQAALGLAQLERIGELNEKRKCRVGQYFDELAGLPWLKLPEYDADSSWHLFVVRVDAGERDRLIDHLLAHGVSAGVHYKPLNTYPIFPNTALPVTDRVWRTLVTIPLFPDMSDDEFVQVVHAIKEFHL